MSKTRLTNRKCAGVTVAGAPCKMAPLTGEEWCWNHHPRLSEERRLARILGGQAGRRRRPSDLAGQFEFEEPRDALRLLEIAANATLCLDNSAGNRTLAQIAVSSVGVWERVTIGERIAALEELPLVSHIRAG